MLRLLEILFNYLIGFSNRMVMQLIRLGSARGQQRGLTYYINSVQAKVGMTLKRKYYMVEVGF